MNRQLQFGLPEGGAVFMTWPDHISVESIDEFSEVVALQIRAVRREAARRRDARIEAADAEYTSWFAAHQPPGEQP